MYLCANCVLFCYPYIIYADSLDPIAPLIINTQIRRSDFFSASDWYHMNESGIIGYSDCGEQGWGFILLALNFHHLLLIAKDPSTVLYDPIKRMR